MSELSLEFIKGYIYDMGKLIKLRYPNISNKALGDYLKNEVLQAKYPQMKLVNNYTNEIIEDVSLGKVLHDVYDKDDYILTGNGCLYQNQELGEASSNKMVISFIEDREEAKQKKLEYQAKGDKLNELRYDMIQLTLKILNNSFYGVTAQPNSLFFNPYIAESITFTGVQIITTSILSFEMLLANNVKYDNLSDLMMYITRILEEPYNILDDINIVKTKKEVLDYLCNDLTNYEMSQTDKKYIAGVLANLSENDVNKIYYKNNLYRYFRNEKPLNLLMQIIEDPIINIHKDIKEDKKPLIDELWTLLKDHVCYIYQIPERYKRALTMERRNVTVIDTDSNFISLDKWINFIMDRENIGLDELSDEKRFTFANSLLIFVERYIKEFLADITSRANVLPDYRKYIKMDNEYFYDRLMITRNKKQYVGLLSLQEGIVINPKKVDMKGLSIKKTTTCKRTEDFFTKVIEEDILSSKKIDLVNILKKYNKFEDEIRESLLKGEVDFLTPMKVGDISNYKFPYRMMGVRGVLTYNFLNPNFPIQLPESVSILKLKGRELPDLEPIHGTKYFDIVVDKIFGHRDEDFSKFGFSTIALPRTEEKIPDWLIPLIDIDSIIEDNITPGILLLESLGFRLMNYRNKEHYSNVIKF